MEALISVGGYSFPEPSKYSSTTATIVDSARNVQGQVVGAVVRSGVAKVEVSWKYLTGEQWAHILSLFNASFYNDVRFWSQDTNSFEIRKMYVSDRTAGMWRRHPETGAIMGWLDCALSLVEV